MKKSPSPIENCPHASQHQKTLTYVSLTDEVRHMVHAVQSQNYKSEAYTQREQEYAECAILIGKFAKEYSVGITNMLDNAYESGQSIYDYARVIYIWFQGNFRALTSETWNPLYAKLENGIGTMLVILTILREEYPYLLEKDCKEHVRIMMRKVFLKDIPDGSNTENIREKYSVFIRAYMTENISLNEEGKAKLFCPAAYTREGNHVVQLIVEAFYKHFPTSSPPRRHPLLTYRADSGESHQELDF